MSVRIDALRVEIDFTIEITGPGSDRFEIPPDDPLVSVIRQWRHEQVLAAARAAVRGIDIG